MRIAIPVENGKLSPHFGRCRQVAVVESDGSQILSVQTYNMPEHEVGAFPQFVRQLGADVVLAGGMGPRAQSFFEQFGIKVITGCPVESAERLAELFISGKLQTTKDTVCDH